MIQRIAGEALVAASPEDVFALVTVPGRWPEWYPITRSVTTEGTAADEPMDVGTKIEEHVRVAGIPFTFTWDVCEVDRPRFVHYQGRAKTWGGFASIHYHFDALSPAADGSPRTRFRRSLEYVQTNVMTQLGDVLLFRSRFRDASDQALRHVESVLGRAAD